ncbi:hypothetical protein AKJ16_DCAP14636 [Drosera capensis]
MAQSQESIVLIAISSSNKKTATEFLDLNTALSAFGTRNLFPVAGCALIRLILLGGSLLGGFRFGHPWKQYLKVGALVRKYIHGNQRRDSRGMQNNELGDWESAKRASVMTRFKKIEPIVSRDNSPRMNQNRSMSQVDPDADDCNHIVIMLDTVSNTGESNRNFADAMSGQHVEV